ncbi:hypothetical protein [Oricola indica]|uniref:hypothetical protein n=1 Tax=Oricola indica TaxID=2872591 RepID=UPI003CCBF32D
MIYSTYIAPSEQPCSSLDIKRALLTYDRVALADPNDRDLFPPQAFLVAMGMPPIMGFPFGAVRPIAKVEGYDNQFDQLMDEVDIARREGLIDVVSSYDQSAEKNITIGAVQMGGYPLDPRFLLWAYRSIGRDNDALASAIAHDDFLASADDETISTLGSLKGQADGGINDDPALPLLEDALKREHLREGYSIIARARIATVMKSIGFCAAKQMIPYFSGPSYNAISGCIAERAVRAIDTISEDEDALSLRSQVLRIAHDEYINEAVLAEMSIDDILKLRSRAWGRQAEMRDDLLSSAAYLARELTSADEFEKAVRERVSRYRKTFSDIETERTNIDFSVRCEIAKTGVLAAGELTTIAGGALGHVTQLQSAMGAAGLLLAGCLWAIDKVKDYKPLIAQLKRAEEEFSDNAGFGMHNFYVQIDKNSRS